MSGGRHIVDRDKKTLSANRGPTKVQELCILGWEMNACFRHFMYLSHMKHLFVHLNKIYRGGDCRFNEVCVSEEERGVGLDALN